MPGLLEAFQPMRIICYNGFQAMFTHHKLTLSDDFGQQSSAANPLSLTDRGLTRVNSIFSLIDDGVAVESFGAGLSCVGLRLSNWRLKKLFPLGVPTGTVFKYPTEAVQDMVSFGSSIWYEDPTPSESKFAKQGIIVLAARAVCLNMKRPQPQEQHRFSVIKPSQASLPEDLKRLLTAAKQEQPLEYEYNTRIRQFAVWT